MRIVRRLLAICLAVLLMAPAVGAQDHVISKSALDKAIQDRVSQEQADREAILSLLQRAEVRAKILDLFERIPDPPIIHWVPLQRFHPQLGLRTCERGTIAPDHLSRLGRRK